MKKLIYFICIMVAGYKASAQNPVFVPSSFTAQDQITLTFDVTGTGMAGATEAYIWLWGNTGDSPLNTSWTNSPDAAKMTAAGTNKWSFTFTPTVMWGVAAGQLQYFKFLLKKRDGSAQTSDQGPFNYDPLIFSPTMLRVFPSKAEANDMVTLNFDKAYGSTPDEQRMTPTTATVTMYDDQGTQVGSPITAPVAKVGDTRWARSFIPSLSFTPAAGRKLAKFKYKFNGTLLDPTGATITVSSSEAELTFTLMQ